MTSKNSWTKIFKIDIAERIHIAVIMLVAGLLNFPFSAFYEIKTRMGSFTDPGQKKQLAEDVMRLAGNGNPLLYIYIVICAAVLGVTALAFLHSKEKADFYLSFPIKREEHYAGRFLGGLALFASLFLIVELILLGVVKSSGLPGDFTKNFFMVYAGGMAYFILLYSIVFLAMILTGKILIGVLGTLVFFFFGSVVYSIEKGLVTLFCTTYPDNNGISDFTQYSPVLKYGRSLFGIYYDKAPKDDWSMIYMPLLWAVGIIILGIILIKKRPGESAQRAMAFRIDSFIKLFISVPLALAMGLLLESGQDAQAGEISKWIYVGSVLFVLLFTWLMDFILSGSIKHILEKKRDLVIGVILVCAVLFGFRIGGEKYDSYIPAQNEVADVFIEDKSLNPLVMPYNEKSDIGDRKALFVPVNDENYRNVQKILNKRDEHGESELYLFMKLKNGKEFQRRYRISSEALDQILEANYKDEKRLREYFGVNLIMEKPIMLYNCDTVSGHQNISGNTELSTEILSAYRKDLKKVHLSKEIQKMPVAVLGGEVESFGKVTLPVTDSFKETIKVMKEEGINMERNFDVSKIQSIETYDNGKTVTDPKEMENILKKAKVNIGPGFKVMTDDGHYGGVNYKDGSYVEILIP